MQNSIWKQIYFFMRDNSTRKKSTKKAHQNQIYFVQGEGPGGDNQQIIGHPHQAQVAVKYFFYHVGNFGGEEE